MVNSRHREGVTTSPGSRPGHQVTSSRPGRAIQSRYFAFFYNTTVLEPCAFLQLRLYTRESLIIFDEIQKFPAAREAIKTLVGDAFFWLSDSMISNECFLCNDPNVGLSLNEDRTSVKCYMGDTGLLLSHTFSEKEIVNDELYKQLLNDKLSINKGMLFENLIAQMLTARGYDLYFYTHYSPEKHRNDIEIDFLLSNGSKTNFKVNPVEVKSSKNYTTLSLDAFVRRFKQRIGTAYVIHPKNYRIDNGIIYLPVYMTFLL